MRRRASVRKSVEPRRGAAVASHGATALVSGRGWESPGLLRPKKHHVRLSTPALQAQMADLLQVGSKPPQRWQMYAQVEMERLASRNLERGHSPQARRQASSSLQPLGGRRSRGLLPVQQGALASVCITTTRGFGGHRWLGPPPVSALGLGGPGNLDL